MNAVVFPKSGGLRCAPAVFLPFKPAPARSVVYGREIADGALFFVSQGGLLPSSGSSIRCEGSRRGRPRRTNPSDRTSKEADKLKDPSDSTSKEADKLKDLQTTYGETSKSSSQEEIIALFRRIQSSISKGVKVPKKRSPGNLKEKQSAESILGTLRKYPTRKQVRAPRQGENRESPQGRGTSEDKIREDAPPSGDFTISRPVSKFVKKSPIPPSSSTKENIREVLEERLPPDTADGRLELLKINEMKLPELKELARTKGVKGYSKLKKGELLELLKGLLQSSS